MRQSALQAMHSHHHTPEQYRNCKHSDPTAVRAFATNVSVEDETELVIDRIGSDRFQSALRSLAIACHGAVAVDRRVHGNAEQFVDLFGLSQSVRMCNVAMP